MSTALQERIDQLFEQTKDLQSLEEIKPHCELFNAWIAKNNYQNSTLGTKLSKYGFYKRFKELQLHQDKNAEQLQKMKANGAVEEKIFRAFQAIADYNDNAPSNDDRWYIGSTTLSQVSKCNRQNIGDWVKLHQTTVDDHNNKYGLGQYHNKRHKGIEVTDKVKLWE